MVRDRLKEFIESQHLTVSKFEQIVGLSNGAVNRTNERIRQRTLASISERFPALNINWLLSGEGDMLVDDNSRATEDSKDSEESVFKTYFKESRQVMVPLINIDSVGGVHSENLLTAGEQHIEGMVPFPNARKDDVAIHQSGDSMSPVIPPGAVLQIRRVDDWREYFGYGNVFVLWLKDERRITKLVKRYDPDPRNYIMCCSYNPNADDEELPKSMIREVWKVVNVLIVKGW